MWTIRQEQVDVFKQAALRQFEDQMVDHLKEFAPRHWKVMGEPDGRKVIRLGIEAAREYGFTNQGPVRFYIELMFMFGSYFDTDPQYPWAGAVLREGVRMDQMERADRLYDATNEYIARVSGPDHKYLLEAMRRLRQARMEDVIKPGPSDESTLEEHGLRQLQQIYPQKCAYLGEHALRALIQHGFGLATQRNFVSDRGMILMAALTFVVGHGFPRDPQYGWIQRRLDQERWPDPRDRADELYSKAMIYLQHILRESGNP
jgi:hypothetical protein